MLRTFSLLAALVAAPASAATVPVHFPSGPTVQVSAPPPMGVVPAQAQPVGFSPRGDAAAVQFCFNIPTLSPLMCEVDLVRPNGKILRLEGGAAEGRLLWTPDGKYLLMTR